MHYGRRVTLERKNKTDPNSIIIDFIHDLSATEMYPLIFNQIAELPGFVHKTTCLIETVNEGLSAVSQLVFDTEENLVAYTSNPATESLTEYLISLANDANIDVLVVDGEIAVLHL
jgi:hypothetical protein